MGRVLCPVEKYNEVQYLTLDQVRSLVGPGFEDPPKGAEGEKARQAARPVGAPAVVFLGLDERGYEGENKGELERPKGLPYFAIDASGRDFAKPEEAAPKAETKAASEAQSGAEGATAGDDAVKAGDADEGNGNGKAWMRPAQKNGAPLPPPGTPLSTQKPDTFSYDKSDAERAVRGSWGDPRATGSVLAPFDAGVFATARALTDWNGRNRFCAACGRRTYSLWGGWKRACSTALSNPKNCFSNTGLHNFAYPRTDPVTIMGVLDPSGEKMLLGRQRAWPKGFYSCLAGFIEPGESFEDAVRREVLEEAGVKVGPVRYSSSQPWPFPANIMVGCYARAQSDEIRLDLDNELEDAQWFPRDVVRALFEKQGATSFTKKDYNAIEKALTAGEESRDKVEGDLASRLTKIPPETAIAGKLIRQWALGPSVDLVSRL